MCFILQFCEIQIYTIHSIWQTPASVNRRHSQERQTAGLLLIKSKHFSFRVKTWQRIIRHYSIIFFIYKNAFIEMYRETGPLLNFAVACFACSVHTPTLSCHNIALEVEQITLLKQINRILWKHMKSQLGGGTSWISVLIGLSNVLSKGINYPETLDLNIYFCQQVPQNCIIRDKSEDLKVIKINEIALQ